MILNPYEQRQGLSARQMMDLKERTINVYNINVKLSEAEIKEFFKQFGNIEKVYLKKDKNENDQKCSILFEQKEECVQAAKSNGKELKGQAVIVKSLKEELENTTEDNNNKKVVISNLPLNCR